MMEQSADPSHNNNTASGREAACGLHTKRIKELENAALQTTFTSNMDSGPQPQQNPESEEPSSGGLSLTHTEAEDSCVSKQQVEEERTLTDHLNKRLLSSFLEKLNERDLALPGVRLLDCAVAEEDSNRAADEW